MSWTPPNLQYLTIYNPSLRPAISDSDDNEDAEEQAHILFYTAKERAVSRDRMLRQIGLAKALVNFAEMFSPEEPCNNVHSQSKRMIMVSPEPNFWIHAAVEVAKVPRPAPLKGKLKAKEKPKVVKQRSEDDVVFDYDDGSILDNAIREDILRGYEQFKLKHGSFTSILSKLGQEALELQLERFFTVWAWSWNLEDGHDFLKHSGVPLHPSFLSLVETLDQFSSQISNNITPIIISPPYIIPSTGFIQARYPRCLPQHLLSIIPPPSESSVDTSNEHRSQGPEDKELPRNYDKGFLGIPPMNMNLNMDMRKWNWPGYLTFGKGSGKGSPETAPPHPVSEEEATKVETEIDQDALEDAISSDNSPTNSSPAPATSPPEEWKNDALSDEPPSLMEPSSTLSDESNDAHSVAMIQPRHLPFQSTTVHIAPLEEPLASTRKKIYYLIKDRMMLALIPTVAYDNEDPTEGFGVSSESGLNVINNIESIIHDNTQTNLSDSLPTANKILEQSDRHMVSIGGYTMQSVGFTSSYHLFNEKSLQDLHPEMSEIFSRGQNPQHWHISKRGLDNAGEDGKARDGEVYLEVFRKETSLTDVDNELVGIVRKAGLVDKALQLPI